MFDRHYSENKVMINLLDVSKKKTNKLKTKVDVYLAKICRDIEFNRAQLVTAISILFSFQRKLISEDVFVRDTRSWLDLLVRTLLQNNPSFQDRLLLLNHVLRCPGNYLIISQCVPTRYLRLNT